MDEGRGTVCGCSHACGGSHARVCVHACACVCVVSVHVRAIIILSINYVVFPKSFSILSIFYLFYRY